MRSKLQTTSLLNCCRILNQTWQKWLPGGPYKNSAMIFWPFSQVSDLGPFGPSCLYITSLTGNTTWCKICDSFYIERLFNVNTFFQFAGLFRSSLSDPMYTNQCELIVPARDPPPYDSEKEDLVLEVGDTCMVWKAVNRGSDRDRIYGYVDL